MKSKLIFGTILSGIVASCANATEPTNYSLTVRMTTDDDGIYVYMMDYDTSAKIDSALVENGIAKISGNIANPFYARLIADGNRLGDLIIEKTDITISPEERKIESNGELYTKMKDMNAQLTSLQAEYRALPNDSTSIIRAQEIAKQYDKIITTTLAENASNPLGYILFVNTVSSLQSLAEMDQMLGQYPQFANSRRVKSFRDNLIKKEETSVGQKYKDFTITFEGKTEKLSDYVGGENYTLVDFWASWCGPCIRETKTIKELYKKYNGKGLKVLGVAVWDEPENTKKAIAKHELPWHSIINAQTIPTDLYGISGIPCIILIAPDGTIVSRDKQGAELIKDVDAAMSTLISEEEAN